MRSLLQMTRLWREKYYNYAKKILQIMQNFGSRTFQTGLTAFEKLDFLLKFGQLFITIYIH
jgi:hypothetical protein